jgi:DNA polymerase I-like protein with 3'-5' exonuclease and polymerase domains
MENLLLMYAPEQKNYLSYLKPLVTGRASVHLSDQCPIMFAGMVILAGSKKAKKVVVCNEAVLKLVSDNDKANLSNYAGSIIKRAGLEFLIIDPLDQLVTVPYGKFLTTRYLSKFLSPANWLSLPNFNWNLFKPAHTEYLLSVFARASFISCDIETGDTEERCITCIGFTSVHVSLADKSYTTTTIVVPADDPYNIAFAGELLRLPVFKIFQNGKYDNFHLIRYGIPCSEYSADTINMLHAWYSELPKDLGFIAGFCLSSWEYHKADGKNARNLEEYYEYNARDCFVTACSFLQLLFEMPDWAIKNFIAEFRLVFPCILAELTGIKIDQVERAKISLAVNSLMDERLGKLKVMVNSPAYNPSSWQQTQKLWEILGSGDIKGTGKIPADKVASRHPLNKRIVGDIRSYREERKALTSIVDKDAAWKDRLLYALNPHGTDTSRLASRESQLSTKSETVGWQVQNIPRDTKKLKIKRMIVADVGFLLGEADYAQNEARGTGYLSGDTNLIAAVDSGLDYHAINVERFFGIPYDQIIGISGEVLNKELRDLSKRTNHGCNYNMGAHVMLDTMGVENVVLAKRLLKLPRHWTLLQVTSHLIKCYELAYPIVKKDWYQKCINDVKSKHMLIGPTGWTRYCFSDPTASKRALNMYVAHPPQSLGAQQLNEAWMKVFVDVYLPHSQDFKLLAQIHDSILFQYRIGHEYLLGLVKESMRVPIDVTDTFGITRTLVVPVDIKGEGKNWSDMKELAHV